MAKWCFFFTVPLAPPENLTIINYTSNSVKLKWSPSPQPNGIIRRYVFTIFENSSDTTFYQVCNCCILCRYIIMIIILNQYLKNTCGMPDSAWKRICIGSWDGTGQALKLWIMNFNKMKYCVYIYGKFGKL